MPSPISAADLINRSLRLAKILDTDETPTASEATDALAVLNDILENWGTQPLAVWAEANDTVTALAGQATYTIGTGGNWNVDRPRQIKAAYSLYQGVSYDLMVIGQEEYNLITLKGQQQVIPEKLLYVADYPLGLVTLWPVPQENITINLSTDRLLDQIPNLATQINFPPGGAKALRYRLAVELAIEYGVPTDPALLQLAQEAMGDYKRANKQRLLSRYDDGLMARGGWVNWRTGA